MGSGRSSTWIAERVAHLAAVERDSARHGWVGVDIAARGLAAAMDYRLIETRGDQLDDEWQAVADRRQSWRAMHIADGLWDPRFRVRP